MLEILVDTKAHEIIFFRRYSDLARAYKEKEKESDKLRDILTKTQDKALRKVSWKMD